IFGVLKLAGSAYIPSYRQPHRILRHTGVVEPFPYIAGCSSAAVAELPSPSYSRSVASVGCIRKYAFHVLAGSSDRKVGDRHFIDDQTDRRRIIKQAFLIGRDQEDIIGLLAECRIIPYRSKIIP